MPVTYWSYTCHFWHIPVIYVNYNRSSVIHLDLVFFSAFEDLRLQTNGTKESNGIRKLHEPYPVPILYVGRIEDLIGLVPLF
jgi:hypothetical protein